MLRWIVILVFIICPLFAFAQGVYPPRVHIVAEGLYYPAGLARLSDGGILIAEAGGHGERSAGVSLLQQDGELGRLLSLVPSGRVDGGLFRAPAIAVSPDGADIILAFPNSGLYSLPAHSAAKLPAMPLTPWDLLPRHAQRGSVFLLHPFDIAFDDTGAPLVADAAGDSLVMEGARGSLAHSHRFARLDNPAVPGGRLDALPTGIARHNNETLVALLGGCPHTRQSGQLVGLDAAGNLRAIAKSLNMPIDVAPAGDGSLWLLEFGAVSPDSDCFRDLYDMQASGRLSRIDPATGEAHIALDGLHFPAAMLPLPDGSLYITEVFRGRLLHVRFDDPPQEPQRYPPADPPPAVRADINNLDSALRRVIDQHGLTAYPGRELIEPDSELTRLGRDLFFDRILSGDKNIACATCHHPDFAMADARTLPIGAGGAGLGESRTFQPLLDIDGEGEIVNPFINEFIPRNSPTIINSALLSRQFWDGRVEQASGLRTLEDAINDLDLGDPLMAQVLFPITSREEMAGVTFGTHPPMVVRLHLLQRLRENDEYAARFATVFGGEMTLRQLAEAIAAFERQLIFTAAPWDDYVAGAESALTDAEKRGALLFFGALNSSVNCAGCHSGDLFTDQDFHNLLTPQLGPGKDNGADERDDFGRANVTFDHRDLYRFKTPGLRNVELTAPYMHSGAYRGLADVIWHHADPWRANIVYAPDEQLPAELRQQTIDYDFDRQSHSVALPMLGGMTLDADEVADIARFLQALTDPAARDLSHITPDAVPSGLPLDQ